MSVLNNTSLLFAVYSLLCLCGAVVNMSEFRLEECMGFGRRWGRFFLKLDIDGLLF